MISTPTLIHTLNDKTKLVIPTPSDSFMSVLNGTLNDQTVRDLLIIKLLSDSRSDSRSGRG